MDFCLFNFSLLYFLFQIHGKTEKIDFYGSLKNHFRYAKIPKHDKTKAMKLSEKDKRALRIIHRTAKSNMAILEIERRFEVLPQSLRASAKARRLKKIFADRSRFEDQVLAENPRATDSRFVGLATNRRNRYMKALLRLQEDALALIQELESIAWRDEHPTPQP